MHPNPKIDEEISIKFIFNIFQLTFVLFFFHFRIRITSADFSVICRWVGKILQIIYWLTLSIDFSTRSTNQKIDSEFVFAKFDTPQAIFWPQDHLNLDLVTYLELAFVEHFVFIKLWSERWTLFYIFRRRSLPDTKIWE